MSTNLKQPTQSPVRLASFPVEFIETRRPRKAALRVHCVPSTQRGFTLIEVLIVVTVMAILAAVIVPTMNSASGVIALESVAQSIAADLRIARQMAVQYNTSYAVTFDFVGNTYQIAQSGSGQAPSLDNLLSPGASSGKINLSNFGAGRLGQARVFLAGAALSGSKGSAVNVTFGPIGSTGPSRNQDTVLWLTEGSGKDRRCILLTVQWITGNVNVGEPTSFPIPQTRPVF